MAAPVLAVKRKKYNLAVTLHSKSGPVLRSPGTFAFMFTNVGDTVARVNGMVVYPGTAGSVLGDSRTVGVAQDELEYVGNIVISFAVGGAAPLLEVAQLFYVD